MMSEDEQSLAYKDVYCIDSSANHVARIFNVDQIIGGDDVKA